MLDKIKNALAKANGVIDLRKNDLISERVHKQVMPSEENAQDRKMLYAICQALIAAGIELDEKTLTEFLEYHNRVEAIKDDVKTELQLP